MKRLNVTKGTTLTPF